MKRKYGALRTISTIYKILAGLAAIITVLLIIGSCLSSFFGGMFANQLLESFGRGGGGGGGFNAAGLIFGAIISFIVLLYGGVITVSLYAMGEMVDLLIALEENTRLTASMLQQTHPTQQSDVPTVSS
ncbi:MAG: hypothetical protein WCI88_04540 [Chloroflexota bacterium]|jgi:amino acid transporter